MLAAAACGDGRDGAAPASALEAGEWKIEDVAYSTVSPPAGPSGPVPAVPLISKRRLCLSPDRTRRPDPAFFYDTAEGACTYRSFAMAAGRMRAVMACTTPGAAQKPFTVEVAGRFTSRQYDVVPRRSGALPIVRFHTSGRFVGPCRIAAPKA